MSTMEGEEREQLNIADVEKQLQAARQKLLDLTMRNRLLNFPPSGARKIRIVDEIPREIYNILVLQEKAMEFLPRSQTPLFAQPGDSQGQLHELQEEDSSLAVEEDSIIWRLPTPDTEVAARHVDRFLQTSLDSHVLQKRLFYIDQESRSILEELGYSTLYLAMGFLEWLESPDSVQTRRAPLILVPVALERVKVASSFKPRWTGDDVATNISLQAMLSEQGISLPDFEMPEDKAGIDQYFQSVATAISTMPKWRVVTDMYLAFFSFTKFIMYKDLDPEAWPEGMSPAYHQLIQAILNPSGKPEPRGFQEDEVDEKLSCRDIYHVMDADPSQIAVIEDAKAGLNLVVEGPPGTGKSQTITNIIAELLSAGRNVLFVSEKMAALEVVKSRLDQVGLGEFCLELHSRKSNKKEVLRELERTIAKPPPGSISLEEEFEQLESLKSELNAYAKALREPFGKLGRSPFKLFCSSEVARRHFEDIGRTMPRVSFSDPEQCTEKAYAEAISKLSTLKEVLPLVGSLVAHPWRGCEPHTVLPSDEEGIGKLINECKEAVANLETAIDRLVETCAIRRPTNLENLSPAIAAARVMAMSKPVEQNVLMNAEWNVPCEQAKVLIDKVGSFRYLLSAVLLKFKAEALDQYAVSMLEEYKDQSAKLFRFFNGRYRRLKRKISTLYKGRLPTSADEIISDLTQLGDCLRLRDEIRRAEQTGHALFGSYWQAEQSDPQMLRAFAEWIVSFRRQLLDEALTERAVDLVSRGVSSEELGEAAQEVSETAKRFVIQRDALFDRIGANCEVVFGTNADKVPFHDVLPRLTQWAVELGKLQRWSQYVSFRNACLSTVASPIVETIECGALEPEDIIPCFEGNFTDNLLVLVYARRPELASFIGNLHEAKIARFAELDCKLITCNRQRLVHKLYQSRPRILGGASSGSEAGILLGEFARKRRHMPIRKLMSLAGGLIQRIKPCFMMSPLSIAQFLDPRTARFDVIIFDEASQVRPEDALGALLRGNQVAVMGDTLQLPPTDFFNHIIESTDDDEQNLPASVAEVESILHQCKRSFPSKTLRWHYRSRHHSLIAFSNHEFYENRLLIYPSPIDKSDYLGLHFVHLSGAIYDRGRSQVNRTEAKAVAEAALHHYRNFPHKSLGIGAFNIRQQQAILEEVELQLRLHPEMEHFFKSDREEHFFVKNLETIQGDERDVIFLSIGYGVDEFGRLTLQFGPLNKEGGYRRLNVLITRARERCIVFSSFRARDLALDATALRGLRALRGFLEYAESGNLRGEGPSGVDTGSPFEDSIHDFLRSHGYEVHKQVGCAGFRVDLAIVEPQSPGRYLLGIECDGAPYHTSPVARDRDRLRQQILENLGWRIHRIWSTDWYRNRNEVQGNLLRLIEQSKPLEFDPVGTFAASPSHESVQVHGSAADDVQGKDDPSPADGCEEPDDMVPGYKVCTSLGMRQFGQLHEYPAYQLAQIVANVVDVEGPLHIDEVVRRIRTLWGLKRAGQRIYDAVEKAASVAKQAKKVRRRGAFLWPATERAVPVRRRSGDPPPDIDLICDEEIAESIKVVLKRQFATLRNDLIVQSSRILGIQATRDTAARRVNGIIGKLIQEGSLQDIPNGMIRLPDANAQYHPQA